MQPDLERSLWMDFPVPGYPPLDADVQADVCVVGAGIAGLSTAYMLAKEGQKVIVIEAASIGGGETGRTTAHLSNALDDRYVELERVHGVAGARIAGESHCAAIDRIEAIVREEGIECMFSRLDGYLFRGEHSEPDILERELAAAWRAGLSGVTLPDHSVATTLGLGQALKFPGQGQFHPRRYLSGLARAIEAKGGRICCDTRVARVEDGSPARVETTRGHTVIAQSVVVATNSPISDRLAIHTKQAAYRTFAIAIALGSADMPRGLFWDTDDPYHYVRAHVRIDGRRVLIVGGEDHKTGQANDAPERFARLETWTRERFRGIGPVEYRWSGQVLEPVDNLAFIGRDPASRHVYIATGDSGHGMTHGTLAGMLITDLVLGRKNPWAELYSPERKSAKTLGTYAKENLNVARQYADYLKRGDVADVDDITPGTGAIVRSGARLLAVYRDDDGALSARSAVCTHVGCIVRWNATESSWDCPCHGSRFDVHGSVLNGPARTPLAVAELEEAQYETEEKERRPGKGEPRDRPRPPQP
jgi:glycine/D-amino acid oxidase-like deaminating enzyme/nitrite reductase/ring-hydroxylating ferredoxin subunit